MAGNILISKEWNETYHSHDIYCDTAEIIIDKNYVIIIKEIRSILKHRSNIQ